MTSNSLKQNLKQIRNKKTVTAEKLKSRRPHLLHAYLAPQYMKTRLLSTLLLLLCGSEWTQTILPIPLQGFESDAGSEGIDVEERLVVAG